MKFELPKLWQLDAVLPYRIALFTSVQRFEAAKLTIPR